jgi:hypothetical protein
MIYTSYEMIRDCRAGRPEGWSYFLEQYVPVIGALLAHYFPQRAADRGLMERVLADLQSSLFPSLEPAPERAFVAELRQRVLAAAEAGEGSAAPDLVLDLETLGPALEPLTLTEKLAAWFETMGYGAEEAGRMLRMSPQTVGQIRGRAAEMLRGSLDGWRRTLLADTGRSLGRAAAASSTPQCLPPKAFFDVIDGRTPWHGREEMDSHARSCWHCLDHFCRLLEVVEVLRHRTAPDAAEIERYRRLLGIPAKKARFWKRA